MTGQNDTPENRATASKAATQQTEALEAIEHFDDIESIYVRGFQDGSIWLADYIEPSRANVSSAALSITWQTLVIFRDVALKESDFERVSYFSAAIGDIATMIQEQGEDVPEIHDDRVPTSNEEETDEVLAAEKAEVVDSEEWVNSLSPEEYQNYLENKADL